MNYQSDLDGHVLYRHELETYRRNSYRALKESKQRRGTWIYTFLNCLTLYTPLLGLFGSGLLVAHSIA